MCGSGASGWLGIRIMCQVGWESRIMCLAGNQDNVSEWSRIMSDKSGAGNQDNVSEEWSGIMCQSGAG